jgi:CheY-like chemotaxis protein
MSITTSAEGNGAKRAPKPMALVVEDDGLTQIYMKTILARHFEVLLAGSGLEARAHLAEHPKDVRIVLMDLSLKGREDGLALTRYLRSDERWRALPIVATTAHAFGEDRRNALEAGCDAYLAKPIEPAQLLAIIRKFLPDAVAERAPRA